MRREGGYITAFSIIISLILISVTLFNIRILDSERKFLKKRVVWFKVNVTLELARGEVFDGLQSGSLRSGDDGSLTFQDGTAGYLVTQISEEVYAVHFNVQIDDTGKGAGLMYYNYVNKEVIQWVVM
ncbi:competence type IV pilus minor pilin ComGG [Pseudalkalibacillus sp. A8]|uniref:competence type IV pilus minor pilin ComGG n=1 Tax=Pseudalkalibacillus sp. A8 TaxID=3382641 RepID=UPI0038B524E8